MKKTKIWISTFIPLLFSGTFFSSSSEIRNIIVDDHKIISLLKQNIPKDYKITVYYIPKEVGGMCWAELNVFHLEESLRALAQKFGNVSSNRDNITIIVQKLQDVRFRIGKDLEWMMQEFECHYREERWQTRVYLDFIADILKANSPKNGYEDCISPSCPMSTTPLIETGSPIKAPEMRSCNTSLSDCQSQAGAEYMAEVGKSLLSLLLIPLAAAIFLLYQKVKSRRQQPLDRPENEEAFSGGKESLSPSVQERLEEKSPMNDIDVV